MNFRKEVSRWGKNIASKYLQENNYEIKQKDCLFKKGKIDIIAKEVNKKELVFIKVKTCSNFKYGNPQDDTNNSQDNIEQAVKYYAIRNHINNLSIRIDTVEVYILEEGYKINHIKKYFRI